MRLAVLCVTALTAAAQQPAAPRFEVASVKLVTGQTNGSSGIKTAHGRLDATNVTVQRCIIGAWGVSPSQVVGGPDWINTERFDISAKADQLTEDDAVFNLMLRGLLAERFHLALHTETRTMQAYVLELTKGGPNTAALKKTAEPDSADSATTTNGTNTETGITARKTSMDLFGRVLSRELRQPVIDRTGLAGQFDFKLTWTPDRMRSGAPTDSDSPTVFTAIQDQLGLRLRSEKVPVEVLVIDHAEKPSDN